MKLLVRDVRVRNFQFHFSTLGPLPISFGQERGDPRELGVGGKMASSNSLHRGCLLGATGWDDCFTHTASLNLRGDGRSGDVRELSAAPEAVGLGRK